ELSFTLNTADRHAVSYVMTAGSHIRVSNRQAPTLQARDWKDPPLINQDYIARRLVPQECALLQGFPDWWCSGLETPEPTEKDISFWAKVFEEHRLAMGKSKRPKSRGQIVKWLSNPHSDSAEWKMWGNGIALPCALFVLGGIAELVQEEG
ncbi:MAG: DNA cytosine methyltransferase, partial [Desulfovibrionaceae bacterium]|nr:DNA cytosine methyltransferase [Desulfovibrionaceae bacterium]